MKKIIAFLMSIATLLGVCTVSVGAKSVSETINDMTRAYRAVIEEHSAEMDLYDFGYTQTFIYDIDKNGVPELIVNDQTLPSASQIYVYTYTNSGVRYIGETYGGRVEFYEYSGNGFMVSYTMDGWGDMRVLSLADDKLIETDTWEICGNKDSYSKYVLNGAHYYDDVRYAISILYNPNKEKNITVEVDGEEVCFDQFPIIENERTLVPMRAIFEAMGCEVYWDDGMIDVYLDDENVMTLWIDDNEMWLPTGYVYLDVAPKLVNDRTFVPLRAISESIGADVEWDGSTRSVIITR